MLAQARDTNLVEVGGVGLGAAGLLLALLIGGGGDLGGLCGLLGGGLGHFKNFYAIIHECDCNEKGGTHPAFRDRPKSGGKTGVAALTPPWLSDVHIRLFCVIFTSVFVFSNISHNQNVRQG